MNIGLLGCGLLGTDIALYLSKFNMDVYIYSRNQASNKRTKNRLKIRLKELSESLDMKKPHEISKRLILKTDIEELKCCDLFIESIIENKNEKIKLFKRLEKVTKGEKIILTNTSSINIDDISIGLNSPDKLLGMNWWNPAFYMPLVEIIKTKCTNDQDVNIVTELMRKIRKIPAIVKKNIPGYIGNRLQFALLREAMYLFNTGIATIEDIDNVVKYGFGLRLPILGPFEVLFCGGEKTFIDISNNLFQCLSNESEVNEPIEKLILNGKLYCHIDKEALLRDRDNKIKEINKILNQNKCEDNNNHMKGENYEGNKRAVSS